jgi:predicted porin
MQPREQDTIVITGTRAPEETTLQGDFIKRETLTATWTHNWSDRVDTSLGGSVGRDTYEGSINDREDDIYNITLRSNYAFRRWMNVYASYAWDDKNSNADNLSYTGQTIIFGVDLSL